MVISWTEIARNGPQRRPMRGPVIVSAACNLILGTAVARVEPPGNRDKIAPWAGEDEMGIELLLLAFGVYAAIWLAVIAGSQFFGPR